MITENWNLETWENVTLETWDGITLETWEGVKLDVWEGINKIVPKPSKSVQNLDRTKPTVSHKLSNIFS
jgi:hypothetical protein